MLLGRGDECDRVDRVVEAGRSGAGGALLLRGEPGIGKTMLLDYARARAEGMFVLAMPPPRPGDHARSRLAMLLRPLIGAVGALPLADAAALRALLISRQQTASAPMLGQAVLALLVEAARDQPLLVIVDDAHLLDAGSAAPLALAARAVRSGRVAMLLAAGDGGFPAPGVPQLHLKGLDRDSARVLVTRRAAHEPDTGVLDQLLDETGGNPLALRELAGVLRRTQLAGEEPLASPLPVGTRLTHAFLRSLERVGTPADSALLLVAVGGRESRQTLEAALRLIVDAPAEASATFDAAEHARLVDTGGEDVRVRHPLMRSAVYHGAPAKARRQAHLALARALALVPGVRAADRRAWHLAAAAASGPQASEVGPGSGVEAAALCAYSRGRYASAAVGLEHAATLAHERERRVSCLLRAAGAWYLEGDTQRAGRLLERAATGCAQTRVEDVDARTAALVLVDSAVTSLYAGRVCEATDKAARARQLAAPLGGTVTKTATLCASAIALAGGQAEGARPLMTLSPALLDEELMALDGRWTGLVALALIWLERYPVAEHALERMVHRARSDSLPARLPLPLALLADVAFRTGRMQAALTLAAESVEVSGQVDQAVGPAIGQALGYGCRAQLDAVRGLGERARSHAQAALTCADAVGLPVAKAQATAALGLLALGLGEVNEAIEQLELTGSLLAEHGLRDPSIVRWTPDLIEAYIRAERTPEALRLLDRFEAGAERTERSWALAATARCRGLLTQPGEFEYHFAAAFRWHARTPSPFEQARTALCLGARLRASRRPVEARVHLRAALGTFEQLGAVPWAQRARVELGMTGDLVDVPSWAQRRLTPKEAEVAWLVAQGRTNREVAQLLSVTPRTVAFHLGNIYRKLDIRSRAELSAAAPSSQLRAS
ncbi:MAG: AAA family ATPase [Egibacteraceae bacterium]